MRKLTFISHPADLGSAALARNLLALFTGRCDLHHYIFSGGDLDVYLSKVSADVGRGGSTISRLMRRVASANELRAVVADARRNGRVLAMSSISAALFTWPFRRGVPTFVFQDWNRKLYEPIINQQWSGRWLTWLHRRVLLSTSGVVCFTDAVRDSFRRDYGIPERQLFRARLPYPVDEMAPSTKVASPIRVLFVGGDFRRKGGDILLKWYANGGSARSALTLVTQADIAAPPGVQVIKNEGAKGFAGYADFDVFALPTRFDAYPVAIGEAASAGLAVATTTNALGSPDIVEPGRNGFIAQSEEEFCRLLSELVGDPAKVATYKARSRQKMLQDSSLTACWRTVEPILFGTSAGNAAG